MKAEQRGVRKVSLVQKYLCHQNLRKEIYHALVMSLDLRGAGRLIYAVKATNILCLKVCLVSCDFYKTPTLRF